MSNAQEPASCCGLWNCKDCRPQSGTYQCPVCKRDTPHTHGEIVDIIDTDKLLRALAGKGWQLSLECLDDGWRASLRRRGYIPRYDRGMCAGPLGTAHLALRALALMVDEDDQKTDEQRRHES